MLSVIIPCFNQAKTLLRAVVSAEKVRGVGEIIIVDDCSDDGSAELIASICAERENVRGLSNAVNSGPGVSRNHGVRNAHGEYVTFLDADDELINVGLFEESMDVIRQNPLIQAVKPMEEFFDSVKGYILPEYDPRYVSVVLSSVHGLVVKKKYFDVIGGFPEGDVFRGPLGGEDVAFMQALVECGPLGKLDAVSYRMWSSQGGHTDQFLAATRLMNSGFEFLVKGDAAVDELGRAVSEFKSIVCQRMRDF
ncbi:glycosyltransferase family 2 protein [Uliginosibacterium sp. 31-12]|uniref:glycosyltransferase family 2 protein n=1 Tax=Uliginosibacterium sp. 31-12 TaxID=3062781 RepID=UPI0026E141AF|nr:glycosyltransferase family 2 protein [Uliginosibacterium sp. 31-12]MDO6384978.1 glycosyltransferase family 2 protein [Uliginosibacterium sp. 31-12]